MEQVDISTFIKFLSGLAPEDETLLLTRQTPRMANGQVQFHPDGAVKATFPAFLPGTKKIKPGESWFANTASFIVDRFKDGKPSASSANCEFCLVLMLDDIGTKSKTPPLEPTWKMETSPGNFQWGYAFTTDQPKKAEFAAAVRAMAEAGYTDPGACNPVRNFRIPGSVNIKPDREGFAARLVEFHPEREFTLPQICEALGVTPGEAESVGPRSLRLTDDGNDDVAAWLSAQGYVYSRPNPEGWMGVHCPQADQHTDGNPESRYNPSMRAWCCMHSHCVDRDSAWFLRWVQEQGGPSHTPGLREELMVSAISSAMSQITPTDAFPDEAARVVAEVERKEAGRIEREGRFERYAYLEQDDGYFDLVDRRAHSRRTFDALYRHVACHSIHVNVNAKPRRIEASTFFDENRVNMGARSVIGMTYAAGETVLCAHEGGVYANRWRNTRPPVRPGGDPTPWLRHIERLIPDDRDRNHVLDVMAFKLQHPERKVNHAILFGSTTHGVGKDLSFKPFFWAIGDSNVKQLKNEQLHTQWGYHLECEVLHINELRQPESVDRRALENKLKPIIAAPPDMLTVERKGAHPYSILNRLLVVAMTNNRDAISIGTDDRRWFVVWSDAPQMNTLEDPDAGKRFSDWLDAGGNEAVAAWLYARDVRAFNPGATPPMTDAKRLMIGAARSMAEAWLIEQIDSRATEFARGVVAGPWQAVCDRLQGMAPPGCRIVPPALLHALREAGWTDLGLCHSRAYKAKRHVFTHPGFAGTKSDAREIVETPATGLRLA